MQRELLGQEGPAEHTYENIAAAIELAINVHLGKRWPLHKPQHVLSVVFQWGLFMKDRTRRDRDACRMGVQAVVQAARLQDANSST